MQSLYILMAALSPELVKRTISTLGTASITIFAKTFSSTPGAPKLVPAQMSMVSEIMGQARNPVDILSLQSC